MNSVVASSQQKLKVSEEEARAHQFTIGPCLDGSLKRVGKQKSLIRAFMRI